MRSDCLKAVDGSERCVTNSLSVIQYPPDTNTVQTISLHGTWVELGFQGYGVRFGHGGATTAVAPVGSPLEISDGARVDSAGNSLGADNTIRAGMTPLAPRPSLLDRLLGK